jgi:hypothetical protein
VAAEVLGRHRRRPHVDPVASQPLGLLNRRERRLKNLPAPRRQRDHRSEMPGRPHTWGSPVPTPELLGLAPLGDDPLQVLALAGIAHLRFGLTVAVGPTLQADQIEGGRTEAISTQALLSSIVKSGSRRLQRLRTDSLLLTPVTRETQMHPDAHSSHGSCTLYECLAAAGNTGARKLDIKSSPSRPQHRL